MGEARFRVEITERAADDLDGIDTYWSARGEAWRGEKYYQDLRDFALCELADTDAARRGRFLKDRRNPSARSILAFGVYRIIYEIDDAAQRVNIIRFWHSHRDTPPLE